MRAKFQPYRCAAFRVVVISIILACCGASAPARQIYVDASAAGPGDGSTWLDAYQNLQSALAAAQSGDEIWVAAGTYKPTTLVGGALDQHRTFQLRNGVAVYGGFTGTETRRDQRDWRTYETVLSGDLLDNDSGHVDFNDLSRQDNCFHLFYHPAGTGLDQTAVLDGFTITGGNANGGYDWNDLVSDADPTGGGMLTSPHVQGGGMYNDQCSPTVVNCIFRDNLALFDGGGMYNQQGSNASVIGCVFRDNLAFEGGGMRNDGASSPIVFSSVFTANSAFYGGGMANDDHSNPVVTNCTFVANTDLDDVCYHCGGNTMGGEGAGGGMENSDSSVPSITNCIFWGNSAARGSQIYTWDADPDVTYSNVQGGCPGAGNIDADPMFIGGFADGLHLRFGSPCIDRGNNDAVPAAGVTDLAGNLRIRGPGVDLGAYECQAWPAIQSVHRFWSTAKSRHFYTMSEEEQQFVIDNYPEQWSYENVAFCALVDDREPNSLPVYRFWSASLSSHFYTIDEGERQFLEDELADVWTFECPAFYAFPDGGQPEHTRPVYRFWSNSLSSHFYTVSEEERDYLIATYAPDVWAYEGIAWWAYEETPPEVSVAVGKEGGVVEVTDPASPLFGVRVEIPAGALAQEIPVTIHARAVDLPLAWQTSDHMVAAGIGPSDAQLDLPVTIVLPYGPEQGEDYVGLFASDSPDTGWLYRSDAEVDTETNTVVCQVSGFGRYVAGSLPKPAPGTYRFWVDPRFSELAPTEPAYPEVVVVDALVNGAFRDMLACMGVTFQKTTNESDADLVVLYDTLNEQMDPLSGTSKPIPAGYVRMGPTGRIVINSEIASYSSDDPGCNGSLSFLLDPAASVPCNAFDLNSLIVRELSHYLGFPSMPVGSHDPCGVFEVAFGPGQETRALTEDDIVMIQRRYPFVLKETAPTGEIQDLQPLISVKAVSPCGFSTFESDTPIILQLDRQAISVMPQMITPSEMVISYQLPAALMPGAHAVHIRLSATTGDPVDADWSFHLDPDADGDGYTVDDGDDDTDATVYPGAPEVCGDGKDNDMDGEVDEAGASGCTTYYRDDDGDGYGRDDDWQCLCVAAAPYTAVQAGDCDDGNPAIHAGATEVPDDGIDQDCDGADAVSPPPGIDPALVGKWDVTSMRYVGGWPVNMSGVSVTFEFTMGGAFSATIESDGTVHCHIAGTYHTASGALYVTPKSNSGSVCEDWTITPDVADYTIEGTTLTITSRDEDPVEYVMRKW